MVCVDFLPSFFMENLSTLEAASALAESKQSWVPFTTPSVSEAGKKLARARSKSRRSRATSRSPKAMRKGTKSDMCDLVPLRMALGEREVARLRRDFERARASFLPASETDGVVNGTQLCLLSASALAASNVERFSIKKDGRKSTHTMTMSDAFYDEN